MFTPEEKDLKQGDVWPQSGKIKKRPELNLTFKFIYLALYLLVSWKT